MEVVWEFSEGGDSDYGHREENSESEEVGEGNASSESDGGRVENTDGEGGEEERMGKEAERRRARRALRREREQELRERFMRERLRRAGERASERVERVMMGREDVTVSAGFEGEGVRGEPASILPIPASILIYFQGT